ncbi:MAG: primosomal protein N' [Solirubrobacterales bacterium]
MKIAKVEPLTRARALRGPFDYRIPREMEGVGVGTMLVVPFGRQRILGVVVDTAGESDVPVERLVEPLRALESGVPAELVRLGLWIADAYCSPPARGLGLVLPPGTGAGGRGSPAARTRRVLVAELTAPGWEALEATSGQRLTDRQRAVLAALTEGPAPATKLERRLGVDHGSLRRLAARDLVALELRGQRRELAPAERGAFTSPARAAISLTDAQRQALGRIVAPISERRHESFLLHGVTGSGKTEVYLRAVATVLEQGRSAIVLVPEIAITPQTAARFEQRFGDQVAIMHSKLGLGERYDEWRRMRDGHARVCVGPRSAVFAPLSDLGLIVIDEEHDSAYKQESDPRYDARRVAGRRARLAGAVLVAGTATPRPESWVSMRKLELPQRVDGLGLPPVRLLDMRGLRHALHPEARAALEEVKSRSAKAIVLVNRRGWSPFVDCRDCGRAWFCPRCEVSLTLHRADDQTLRCHHCGHSEEIPSGCPDCGSTAVARHGTGTQRLEAELREALAPMPVLRLDADAAQRKGGIAHVLERFTSASSGVLIGTQMVAQGHDFPDVELALVQDADAGLRFPDFRAEERTFTLVAQLAGRSGRGPNGGRVLVQTLNPQAGCLKHAAQHDAAGFLGTEVERRKALSYPPFVRLVRVIARAADQAVADRATKRLAGMLELPACQLLGPAPLYRLKDRYRSVLLLKSPPQETTEAVAQIGRAVQQVATARELNGVKIAVDVDPQ